MGCPEIQCPGREGRREVLDQVLAGVPDSRRNPQPDPEPDPELLPPTERPRDVRDVSLSPSRPLRPSVQPYPMEPNGPRPHGSRVALAYSRRNVPPGSGPAARGSSRLESQPNGSPAKSRRYSRVGCWVVGRWAAGRWAVEIALLSQAPLLWYKSSSPFRGCCSFAIQESVCLLPGENNPAMTI